MGLLDAAGLVNAGMQSYGRKQRAYRSCFLARSPPGGRIGSLRLDGETVVSFATVSDSRDAYHSIRGFWHHRLKESAFSATTPCRYGTYCGNCMAATLPDGTVHE
jgi:hypothetical protein